MQELKIVRGKIQSHYMLVKTDEDLGWNRAIDLCTNIINAHIKHMTDGWIPVEERMPEEGKEVLVTTDQGMLLSDIFATERRIQISNRIIRLHGDLCQKHTDRKGARNDILQTAYAQIQETNKR